MNAFLSPQSGEFTLPKFGDSKLLITERPEGTYTDTLRTEHELHAHEEASAG